MTKHIIVEKEKEAAETVFLKVQEQFEKLKANHNLFVNKGNKQASRRARVATVELGKLFKEYRAKTLAATLTKG